MIFDRILFGVSISVVVVICFSVFALHLLLLLKMLIVIFGIVSPNGYSGCDFSSRDLRPFAMIYELRKRQGNSCNLRRTRFGLGASVE